MPYFNFATYADVREEWASHECCHWTRAKHRLDRDFGRKR